MNILVVDDDFIIRETLSALLDQYRVVHEKNFEIFVAEDGQKAIELVRAHGMGLVFMDINMPGMNGVEATKAIKAISKDTMIVAISSIEEHSKQRELLEIGAEDYIVKPVVAELFKRRLSHYLKLIESRHQISFKSRAINCYTTRIYNYTLSFTITTEDDLSEFWEALLMRFELQKQIPNLNDFVRFIYQLGQVYIHYKYQFQIFMEEDTNHFFFTLTHAHLISQHTIENLIAKCVEEAQYEMQGGNISFAMSKMIIPTSIEVNPTTQSTPKTSKTEVVVKPAKEIHRTFSFLEADDLDDLETTLDALSIMISRMNSDLLNVDEVHAVCNYLGQTAGFISTSNETFRISDALRALAADIILHKEVFIEKGEALAAFITAFVNDLIHWKEMIFYAGAPSIDFMDASIIANAEMIRSVLDPKESEDAIDLDDIFSF